MVLSKIYLAFSFAVNIAAMAINPTGTIHERDGVLFISHRLADGTQKVQYLSEYKGTTPEGTTTDCRANRLETLPICGGVMDNPDDAIHAQQELAELCGDGLIFSERVQTYYGTASTYVHNFNTEKNGYCTRDSINRGIDEIIASCGQDKRGILIDNPDRIWYGRYG